MSEISEGRDNVIVRIEYLIDHLPNSSDQSKPIIFKVDDQLRQVCEKDYEPEMLAIGPIHRGKDSVKGMEHHKVRYLQQLVQRKHDLTLEILVVKLREIEKKARQCYSSSSTHHLDEDEFVEMLLLDGCFLIELLRKFWLDYTRDKNDQIFQHGQTLERIRHDLMLFENQLPFFVLNQLFDMSKSYDPEDRICFLVVLFMGGVFPWLDISKVDTESDMLLNVDHLLGLVYHCCFSFSSKDLPCETKGHKDNKLMCINSASELKEAGIRLKLSEGITLLDVTFVGGVVEIPPLIVTDKTESILRNLIAYEVCLPDDHPRYVIAYVFLMHCLLNSTKDCEILRRCGIITNLLGDDDSVRHMFNRLGKNVYVSSDFCYLDIFQSVIRHCNRTWMGKLRHFLLLPCCFYSS